MFIGDTAPQIGFAYLKRELLARSLELIAGPVVYYVFYSFRETQPVSGCNL